jgi:hypothetical protein
VQDFLIELNNALSVCSEKNLIVTGDINLCILKQTANVDEYKMIMSSHGLDQLISAPTRKFANSRSCLDHIYLRCKHYIVYKAGVINSGRSDHDLTVCALAIDVAKKV